ncbi:zinc finger protein RFP-like isoform X1 [Emydura macquarii macquarii]|uniref:zinc finger protein RFP-like isoform X1 n=1 Tax=Emydura macquarii macquarii TaxID=1129001 RepID=UPI00352B625F
MATAKAAKTLQDEATCPICLEYFNDPVSLDCNHDFCRACITRCWKEFDADISCPQCRKTFPQMNLKPNRKLKSIVEAARELSLESGREPETERLCEKHREPLKLFCKEDEIPICLVCDRAKEHRDHTVVPAEEAVEEFQEKIQAHLKKLREEREKLVKFQASKKKRSQENLRKTKTERQKIVSEFQQLRGFLEEQEQLLLAQLLKLDEEILKIQTENMNKLSVEMSRLTELISDIEGKYQKPASEFLQKHLEQVRGSLSLPLTLHNAEKELGDDVSIASLQGSAPKWVGKVTLWIKFSLINFNFILRFSPFYRRLWNYPFSAKYFLETSHPRGTGCLMIVEMDYRPFPAGALVTIQPRAAVIESFPPRTVWRPGWNKLQTGKLVYRFSS